MFINLPPSRSSFHRILASVACLATALSTADVSAQAPIHVLRDIVPGVAGSSPTQFVELRGQVIFPAHHPTYGQELWRTDGTTAGTQLLVDLMPGTGSSNPQWLTVFKDHVWFNASVSPQSIGNELYVSDGTAAGTGLFLDIVPGIASSAPSRLTAYRDHLYFNVRLAPTVEATFVTDGTVAGTVQIGAPTQSDYVGAGAQVFYVGFSRGTTGAELWASDGTPNGTREVKDIMPGVFNSMITSLTALDHRVVFAADDGVNGHELWISDGTAAGTQMLRDIRPGPQGSGIASITAFGGKVYFIADDGVHGGELWVSDGTTAGTQLLADLHPGPSSSMSVWSAVPRWPVMDGYFLFNASAPSGAGLWRSDGTAAGTVFLANGALAGDFARAGKRLWYCGAPSGGGDREPWVTDGTAAGTHQLVNLNPTTSSSPTGFLFALGRMFLTAMHPTVGLEPLLGLPGAATQPFASGCGFGGRVPGLMANDPVLGSPLRLDGNNAHAGASGAIIISARTATPLQLFGCPLWIDPLAFVALPAFTVPAANWNQSLPVPADPNLQHAVAVTQALFIQTPGGFETTNPVVLTLGL